MERSRLRTTLFSLLILLSFLQLLPHSQVAALPTFHLMQENSACGTSPCSSPSVGAAMFRGQSFVASDGYNLTRISLNVNLSSPLFPGAMTLSLRANASGAPGAVIASSRAQTSSTSLVWLDFNFPPGIPLIKGVAYWMVANTSGLISYGWTLSGSDTYPAGRSASSTANVTWTTSPLDQLFRIYGYVDSRISVAMTVDADRAQPQDILHYTIYFNNTGNETAPRVWINATLTSTVTYQSDNASANGGAKTGNYNWSFANVAQGRHSFGVVVRVNPGVPRGTFALNTVTLDYLNSINAKQPRSTARVTTIIGLKVKTLYLHYAGRNDTLDSLLPQSTEDCNAPGAPCDYDGDGVRGISLAKGGSHFWRLNPPLAEDFTILGRVNVTLWLDDGGSGGNDAINITLARNNMTNPIASATLSFKPDRVQGFQPFSQGLSGLNATLPKGSTLLVRLTVPLTSDQPLQVAYDTSAGTSGNGAFRSRIALETPSYIRVAAIELRDSRGVTNSFAILENVAVNVTVSDALGIYDIVDSGTSLDLYDPALRPLLSGVAMGPGAKDPGNLPAWRSFSKTFLIPADWPQGNYTLRVVATERDLVTAAASTSLTIRAPVFKPVLTASRAIALPGDPVTYTLYFNNTGTVTAPKVWINDTFSPYEGYRSDNASTAGGTRTGNYNWTFANVAPGTHFFLLNATLALGVPGTTMVVNLVVLTYLDQKANPRGPMTAQASTTTDGPFMTIAKTASPPYAGRADKITYTIYFNNTGNRASGRVWINDTLPASVVFQSTTASLVPSFQSLWIEGGTLHLNFTNVAPGAYSFTVVTSPFPRLPGGTQFVNTARMMYLNTANALVGPSTASARSYLAGPKVTLRLNMTPTSTDPGARIAIKLRYDNIGAGVSPAYRVSIRVDLGSPLYLVDASPGATYNASTHTLGWFLAIVYPGNRSSLFANATLAPGVADRTPVLLSGTATSFDEFDNAMPPAYASRGFNVTAPVLSLMVLPQVDRVPAGMPLNYSLLFNNTGTGRARDVWINVTLNPNTVVLAVSMGTVADIVVLPPPLGNRVSVHLRNLAPGAYWGTLEVQARSGFTDGLRVDNGVTVAYTDGNGNLLPRVLATAAISILAPRLRLALAMDRNAAGPGDALNLTYLVTNLGNATSQNAWLNVTIPQSLMLLNQTTSGEWTELNGIESWHFRDLKPGGGAWVRLKLRVRSAAVAGLLPLPAVLSYTDTFGLSRESASSTDSVRIVTPAEFPWIYSLLLLIPAGLYLKWRMPLVEEVFVVYQGGRLMAHRSRSRTSGKDDDILAGMLTAVQDFIKDAFSARETRELKSMNFGDHVIDITRGEYLYLAVIHRGQSNLRLARKMRHVVTKLEGKYGELLPNWNGLTGQFAGLKDDVKVLFRAWRRPRQE